MNIFKYIEISPEDWSSLNDKQGFYCVKYRNFLAYKTNGKRHREDGPSYIQNDGQKEYYLHDVLIVNSNLDMANYYNLMHIPSDEYWIKYCKLRAFE